MSPCLTKSEMDDLLKFQFNPAFDFGFPQFTDPDYKHFTTLLDGISDLDVLCGDDLRVCRGGDVCSFYFEICAQPQTAWTYHYLVVLKPRYKPCV